MSSKIRFLRLLDHSETRKTFLRNFYEFNNYFGRNGTAFQEDSSFSKTAVIIPNLVEKDFFTVRKYSSGSKYLSTRICITFRDPPSLKDVK